MASDTASARKKQPSKSDLSIENGARAKTLKSRLKFQILFRGDKPTMPTSLPRHKDHRFQQSSTTSFNRQLSNSHASSQCDEHVRPAQDTVHAVGTSMTQGPNGLIVPEAGTNVNPTPQTQTGDSGPRYQDVERIINSLSSTLSKMSPEELRRHQASKSEVGVDDPWYGRSTSSFLMPNTRPAGRRRGQPDSKIIDVRNFRQGQEHTEPISESAASDDPSSVEELLRSLPGPEADATRQAMFTELIKMRTKELELQIAEARSKEREAEVELEKLKQGTQAWSTSALAANPVANTAPVAGPSDLSNTSIPSAPIPNGPAPAFTYPSSWTNDTTASFPTFNPTGFDLPAVTDPAQQSQPFDIDSFLQSQDIDNLLSWLPSSGQADQPTINPSDLFMQASPMKIEEPTEVPAHEDLTTPAPPDTDHNPAKKTKVTEKKGVLEKAVTCQSCATSICRTMIRMPKSQLPKNPSLHMTCLKCKPAESLTSTEAVDKNGMGTLDTRKRLRIAMEIDDEDKKPVNRRMFCDVCQRMVATGRIFRDHRSGQSESLFHHTEIVCATCDSKYSRCTDCGGGGKSRIGIGKWRLKEAFTPGRKTCRLSHNRITDKPKEIGLHVTPTDFTTEQLQEVLDRLRGLWHEKTLSRLAVPDMIEIDPPPGVSNPLQKFSDIEDIVHRKCPIREAIIKAEGLDETRFKRLLALTWVHARLRRSVRTVDLEDSFGRSEDKTKSEFRTVLDNVTKTDEVIPPGSELVGVWGGEWDMLHGSLLITVFVPFEGADGDDSTAVAVGEMVTKVQSLRNTINAERTAQAQATGSEPDLLPQCEHLWVVSGNSMPLVRERISDVLIKKRSFVPVDEYLTRHPEFIHALNARPWGLTHDPAPNADAAKPLVLVRWLGKDFNAQQILEIKQQEFGGKSRPTKKLRTR